MTTKELKQILIYKIEAINDKNFLKALLTIVEHKSDATIYKLTPEQEQCIKESQEQFAKGEYKTNEQAEKEITHLLHDEKRKIYDQELKPMSIKSFNANIDQSEDDAANGRVIDAKELKKDIGEWK